MLKFKDLRVEMEALGEVTARRRREAEAIAQRLLRQWVESPDMEAVRRLLGETATFIPQGEGAFNASFPARPGPPPSETVVIGVDGSQIMPDRHAAILYYLIQVGGMIFRYNGQAPAVSSHATLHYDEERLYDEEGYIVGARQVSMRREVAELAYMLALAEEAAESGPPLPILALTDGPLLWPYTGQSSEEAVLLQRLFGTLKGLRRAQTMPIGFVERPAGNHLVRLLYRLSGERAGEAVPRLTDAAFLRYLLPPGHRTVWFLRRSPMQERYQREGMPIWSAYLNVGYEGYPIIARLECPAWAVERTGWADLMQQTLIHQSHLAAGHPYVLARAHEMALVTTRDKFALERRLRRILLDYGVRPRPSAKAQQKAILGKR